ncbi:hypothetical protein MBGDF03_01183 [Thermoplasmatales archaeon SCGC AB-540-F20]|nr:hypothetical protein MBGDF03_01183 [Thermoplasmatales archaeon SCGC AB-540-F20]
MKKVEKVRNYVFDNYIDPARENGEVEITVRAGDVGDSLGLSDRMPLVCTALTRKIDEMYNLKIVNIQGPPSKQGRNLFVTYRLL